MNKDLAIFRSIEVMDKKLLNGNSEERENVKLKLALRRAVLKDEAPDRLRNAIRQMIRQ